MKFKDLTLKTAFDIGYQPENVLMYGRKMTRNICGFNVTMHFKPGVCKIKINNIEKIHCMVHLPQSQRNVDLVNFNADELEKLQPVLDNIKKEITKQFYDTTAEPVCEYNPEDLDQCCVVTVSKKKVINKNTKKEGRNVFC